MKKPFIYLLSAGLAVSMIANTGVVYAAGSEATVEFTPATGSVDVVNPKNPVELYPGGQEGAEADGTVTGESGPLTLDYISNISFGSEEISTTAQTYESVTSSPFIQVSDRRGTGEGWNVTASVSNFTDDSQDTLPSARITLANGTVDSTSKTPLPGINENIVLETGGSEITVVSATPRTSEEALSEAEGLGTWVMRWLSDNDTNENVTLYVPEAAATEGTHTATITWNLTSGPSADDTDFDTVIDETEE